MKEVRMQNLRRSSGVKKYEVKSSVSMTKEQSK